MGVELDGDTNMMAKRPKSIRVEDDQWESFIRLCNESGSTATEQIELFITRCLEFGLPSTDEAIATDRIDERIGELAISIEERIDIRIDSRIDETVKALWGEISALQLRMESVGKLAA